MNKFIILLACISQGVLIQAQTTDKLIISKHPNSNQEWIQVNPKESMTANLFLKEYQEQLRLPGGHEFKLLNTETDGNNWSHFKYQQYFQGIKIQGAEFILHEQNGEIKSANGRVETDMNLNTVPQLTKTNALEIALNQAEADKYIWDIYPELFPVPELVLLDKAYPEKSGELILVYKVDVFSISPMQKIRYYIDAQNGNVMLKHDAMVSCFGGPGSAQTLYNGTQQIETEEGNGEFILKDNTRGGGIITQSITGNHYSDGDNFWEEASFTQKVGALDVHYGAQSTFDFFKTAFNRDGIDGKNSRVLCKILDTSVVVNAFWESATQSTLFGTGDNVYTGPLTSLDVVGHEMTHGLTEHTCSLEYLYEAGALNEGFSDIFGKTIEFKYSPANFDWLIGSKFFFQPDTAFRSMSDPNRFKNPKHYKGKNWNSGSGDNGGVHTNSGVINHWFYLLVTGQTGTSESGKPYQVEAMGFDTTIQIIFQMMKNYLTSTSYYHDAKEASLQVTENLYGKCSKEYRNVSEAWKAVGVGSGVTEGDLILANHKIPQIACKEGLFPVEVRVTNQGCNDVIPKDTDIRLTVSVPQKNKIIENITLDTDLLPGESFIHKFSSPAKIDKTATLVTVEIMVLNRVDADTSNNRFTMSITKNNNNEHDFRLTEINISGSPCESGTLNAQVRASYSGCHPVPAGTDLSLTLKYDNEIINRNFKTVTTLYPGANYRSTIFPLDRTFAGYKRIQAILDYTLDTLPNNNSTYFNAVYIDNSEIGYLESFDNNQFDSTALGLRVDSFQTLAIQDNFTGSEAMIFSGGKIFDANNNFIPVNGTMFNTFMTTNSKFTSTLYLCIDTKDLTSAYISFDYLQKIGNAPYDTLLLEPSFAVGTRIQFRNDRGTLIGSPTYITNGSKEAVLDYYEQEIPLTGGPVSIEITNLSLEGNPADSSGIGIDTSKDYVLMDNIRIFTKSVSTKEDSKIQDIAIYPNPFQQNLWIQFNKKSGHYNYKLYNLLGTEVLSGKVDKEYIELNTVQLPEGNYVFKTYSDNGNLISKLLIKLNQ